jgi:hypothetical protein
MSSTISLQASVKTCTVDVGMANRIQSDRFINPNNMVCVAWDGNDLTGRQVSPDSFYTKTPGCNSAEDRVLVENDLRPAYFNYITLSGQGVDGQIYGNQEAVVDSANRQKWIESRNKLTGSFNNDFSANLESSGNCSLNAYENAMAQVAQAKRQQNAMQNGYNSNVNRRAGGF